MLEKGTAGWLRTLSPPLTELPIFIINLKFRTEKLQKILKNVNGTFPDPVIIEAVDGRSLNKTESTLTRGEIGCFKSHIMALTQFVSSGYPYGLILEDDAQIKLPDQFESIKNVVDKAPAGWGAISLGVNYDWMPPDSIQVSDNLYELNDGILLGTHAIIYTQEAARQLVREQQWIERWAKEDSWYSLPFDLWVVRPGSPVRVFFVAPAIASQTIKGSDTQGFE